MLEKHEWCIVSAAEQAAYAGFRHNGRVDKTPLKRILLACTQRIGDVLLATPLARSMKRAWPEAELDMLVFRGTETVLEGNPDIAQVIAVPRRAGFGDRWQELRGLWRHYDLAVSPLPTDRARIYCWAAGRVSLGLIQPKPSDRHKALLLNRWRYFDDLDTHTVSMGLALAEMLHITPSFEVVPPGVSPAQLAGLLAKLAPMESKPFAVLHPWPTFAYKMWTREAWLALARWLKGHGLEVVFAGGPEPDESAYVEDLALQAGALSLAASLSLGQTAELIRRAKLYVGPDTVVTHIAAATGTPTIALFGPSNPVKWGPWPKDWASHESPWQRRGSGRQGNVVLIQGADVRDCVPCMLEGCERRVDSSSECLLTLDPSVVIQVAARMLSGRID